MNPMPVTQKQAGGAADQQAAAGQAAATAAAGKAAPGKAAAGHAAAAGQAATSGKAAAPSADKPAPGWIAFVGAGPGDASLLTVRAAQLLAQADLVVAGPEIGGRLAHLIRAQATVTDSDALQQDPRLLVKAARAGQLVVRLFGGDPFMFCNAAAEAAVCAKAKVSFEIVPGVSAATAIPAYAGIPLTSDSSGDVRIVHAAEVSRISAGPGTLVILGAETGPADLGKMLLAAGWADSTPFAITWNGTTTDQHTVLCTLGSVTADLKAAGVSLLTAHGPATAVVGDCVTAQRALSWFETKPLFGWRVLVPRTKEQAEEVSDLLRARGAVPEQVPTIAVEPPRTPQQMERAVKGLVTGRYQWIAFTSVNAVRAVREKFEEYGLDARAFAGVKVAAVGEQTAAALRDFGIMPDLVPDGEQSAEGLADAWPAYDDVLDPINRVLLPRADIATESLVARLTDLGWEAEDVTAYRTVRAAPPPAPIREAIKGGGFDAVLFTSSSTVRNLIGIAGKPHAVTVIAVIGPQTAKTAAEFGLRVDVLAPKPSVAALVEALAEFGAGVRDAAVEAGEPVRRPSERRRGARRRIR
jgi:uroporphyrinogen III methyltransferase/synthase